MTTIEGPTTQVRDPSSFALVTTPVATPPKSAPAATSLSILTPSPPPSVINRDTVTHGLIAAGSVAGVGALTLVAGSSTLGLVAAALAAGVTTAIAAVRFLGMGGATQRQLLAHMASERAAMNATGYALTTQLSSLADDRRQLVPDREHLASERLAVNQRAADEAQRIIAPLRQELEAERARLAAERESLNAWVSSQNEPKLDAARLSESELAAITEAIGAYNTSSNQFSQRFVGELYVEGQSSMAQRMIPNERVVATLVGRGKVYAGTAMLCPDNKWVVQASAATTITSIPQLREFLRLATGRRV